MQGRASSSQRRYGFACAQCRRRKLKCDGTKPICRRCMKTQSRCVYKDAEGASVQLRDELIQCQKRLHEVENGIQTLAVTSDHDKRDSIIQQLAQSIGHEGSSVGPEIENDTEELRDLVPDHTDTLVVDDGNQELTVDEHGVSHYFGATSRFHTGSENQPQQPKGSKIDKAFHKKWLKSNARFQKKWEKLALENLDDDPDIDSMTAATLLNIYWAWQAPLHNCVYRQCFFRDMAIGGPYFNKFLLNVIYAHASRHVSEDDPMYAEISLGEKFLAKAKLLLVDELGAERPSIPTIQGLLILGGRQCAVGKSSEGWLYTGMAIRMIKDLGLHLNNSRLGLKHDPEPEDLEARKRLYLSAYAWDKSISLCLGRPPSLTELPYSPNSIYDDSGDFELWTPFYLSESAIQYPPTTSLTTLTFINFCELSSIINRCYDIVYSGKAESIRITSILVLEKTLQEYRQRLPQPLKIDNANVLDVCPPPHIFCLNILCHTLMILIYRPFFTQRADRALYLRARDTCLKQAMIVNTFFRLYGKTFNFRNQSYLISYCVYTAATVELQELRTNSRESAQAAVERLTTTMKMLETEAKQTPGIRRSIDIIKSQLASHQSHEQTESRTSYAHEQKLVHNTDTHSYHTGTYTQDFESHNPDLNDHASAVVDECTGIEPFISDGYAFHADFGVPQDDLMPFNYMSHLSTQFPMNWNAYDAGGGFVPDMTNWTWYDTMAAPDSC